MTMLNRVMNDKSLRVSGKTKENRSGRFGDTLREKTLKR